MNFSFPPSGRGGPVFNFKSEGRRFDKSNRCLISASAFFEFTGKKYPKAKQSLHAERRALPRDCRNLAGRKGRRPARVYDADDIARTRCGAANRGASPGGLGRLDLSDQARKRAAAPAAGRLAGREDRAGGKRLGMRRMHASLRRGCSYAGLPPLDARNKREFKPRPADSFGGTSRTDRTCHP